MSKKDYDEEVIDSETNDHEGDEETPEEDNPSEETPEENDDSSKEEDQIDLAQYRQQDAPEKKGADTVPLSKFLELKNELKELKRSSNSVSSESLESFAEDAGLDIDVVRRMATVIASQAKEEALAEVDSKVRPVLREKQAADNDALFTKDFEKNIVSRYPELADKKEAFKAIAFSKDFLHLKTLEDIRKEFFSSAKQVKKETFERGSIGADNLPEDVDFAKMDDETHAKVLADPKLRKEYYAWQDQGGV